MNDLVRSPFPGIRYHSHFEGDPSQPRCVGKWGVQNYAVVIHEDPDGGFWGEVPALPGCYSQGETIDDLEQNIREAIAGVVDVLKQDGREPDSTIQILNVAV